MKKVIYAAVAVCMFGFAKAQNVNFGAKAGLNISSVSGESDAKSRVGFAVGAFAEFKVSEKFSIQPEVLYSVLGAKAKGVSGTESSNYSLSYINIPVMAKYYVAEKFSLEAGPQIGFLTSAKYTEGSSSIDIKNLYKSTDFGLNVGAGYDVSKNIAVGVRYTAGLSNISTDSATKQRNQNFAIALAYKF
jgi:opacity protein-like surface antigen